MKLLCVFLVFISLGASAQTRSDYLSYQKVLSEKVQAIQLEIWNGVVNGKLVPYQTVSLDSVVSSQYIREKCAGIDSLESEKERFRCGTGKRKESTLQNEDTSVSNAWDKDGWDNGYDKDSTTSSDVWDFDSIQSNEGWGDGWSLNPIDSALGAREDTAQEQEKRKYNLKDEQIFRFDFDSTRDLTGFSFGFENNVDLQSASINYDFSSLAVLSDLFTGSGINLGSYPVFWVSKKELSKVLSPEELLFLNALVLQRSSLGDFTPSWMVFDRSVGIDDWTQAMDFNRFEKYRVLKLAQREIAVLAEYNARTFISIGTFILENKESINQDKYLFKDSSLSIPYNDIKKELSFSITFEHQQVNDSYGLVSTWISNFEFDYQDSVWIKKSYGDYLAHFIIKNDIPYENDGWEVKARRSIAHIYMSYSSIKHLLQPHDRIVLEALLTEIVN